MRKTTCPLLICLILMMVLMLPPSILAKKWDIEADSVELTDGDIDRPYEIKEIVSFTLKRQLAEESALEARDRLKKTAADKGCDAVILVDHYTERDPTELFTNAVLVQSLDSAEIAERRKQYGKVDEVREKVENKEIILSEKDINYPYKVKMIADVIVSEMDENTIKNVDGQLADLARKKRGHAVVYIKYDRAGTQVNGAKGVIVKFPRKWLKTGELD